MKHKLQNTLSMILSAMAVIWVVACASTGQNFDESKVSQIRKGETTEAELIQLFGQPTGRGLNSDGLTTLSWEYFESRVKGKSFIPYAGPFVGGSNTSHKRLTVTLGSDGKVASYDSSTGGMESRSNQVQEVPRK